MVELTKTLEVPFAYRKHFSIEECQEMVNSFKNYDTDNNGSINANEFKKVLKDMGHSEVSEQKLQELFAKVDYNENGVVDWLEFLQLM